MFLEIDGRIVCTLTGFPIRGGRCRVGAGEMRFAEPEDGSIDVIIARTVVGENGG